MDRQEAIEVVRKNFPDSNYSNFQEALEVLIPELREYGDERVRQDLLTLCCNLRNGECVYPPDKHEKLEKAIAWLERQGQQKPTWDRDDEKMIEALTNGVEHLEVEDEWNYIYSETDSIPISKVKKWLKSLEPKDSWKPKMVYLIALKWVSNNIQHRAHKEEIDELLNELQKL